VPESDHIDRFNMKLAEKPPQTVGTGKGEDIFNIFFTMSSGGAGGKSKPYERNNLAISELSRREVVSFVQKATRSTANVYTPA